MSDFASLSPESIAKVLPAKGFGPVNWRGLWTLLSKETNRFLKIYSQTIVAPAITTLLLFVVFGLAMGKAQQTVGGVPFLTYLLPGLVIMSIAQNAFFSTSAALILGKLQGYIIDLVMAPLSPFEWTLAFALSGVVRGVLVGVITTMVLYLIAPITIVEGGFILYHAVMGALMMSLLGVMTGVWADKFDQMATVQNFIVMPATFLSGTFFSVDALPGFWGTLCRFNPFFYMIDGFRYGFTGVPESSLVTGLFVMLGVNLVLFILTCRMVARADKLKN